MIVKTNSIKSSGGVNRAIDYVFKPKKIERDGKKPVIIKKLTRSRTIEGYKKSLKQVQELRMNIRKDMNYAYHTKISLGKLDAEKVNDAILKSIATKFMALRGSLSVYVAVVHFDKPDMPHLHIIHSANDLRGKATRQSKGEFAKLKRELEEYQREKFPELVHSKVEHRNLALKSDKQISGDKFYKNRRTESDKSAIGKQLQSAYAKAHSLKELIRDLESNGYEIYYRNGRPQGICHKNLKHRFSKFGLDKDKFSALKQLEEKEEKILIELNNNRSSNNFEKERNMEDLESDQIEIDSEMERTNWYTEENDF